MAHVPRAVMVSNKEEKKEKRADLPRKLYWTMRWAQRALTWMCRFGYTRRFVIQINYS